MAKSIALRLAVAGVCAQLLIGCGGGNDNDDGGPTRTATPTPVPTASPTVVTKEAVVARYADLLLANYSDVVAGAEALQETVDAFVAAPSASTLAAAKQAWLDARPTYQETEIGRFYDGPIDNPDDGPEGFINAWPLDESYIDYVEGNPDAGIINDPAGFPDLTAEALRNANEDGGETNIATGWHAIEFLLWGQDRSADGPGDRPFTDYVPGGTAANQARRGEYLRAVAALLVADLEQVRDAWTTGDPGNYRAAFLAVDPDEALRRILTGAGTLSAGELAGERLSVAFETRDQEDEHSCFSDNTHVDHEYDQIGIQNVYLGRYGSTTGPGVSDLVRQLDPALDARIQAELAATLQDIRAIPEPFDQAILGSDDLPGRQAISTAIDALLIQNDSLAEAAAALGISIGTGQ